MNKTCTASGVDWTCDRPAEKGRTLCPGHRGQHREGRELTPLRAYNRHEPKPPKQPMSCETELAYLIKKQNDDPRGRAVPAKVHQQRTLPFDPYWRSTVEHDRADGTASEWGKGAHETPTLAELEQEDYIQIDKRPAPRMGEWTSAQDAIVSDDVPGKLQALGRLIREKPLQTSDPEAEEQPDARVPYRRPS